MIDYRNPYTPGAGVTPRYLAGREEICENAMQRLESISTGYQAKSVIYYGLRGVGKTVLLNCVEEMSENRNILTRHIEVKEASNFVRAVATASIAFVKSLSFKESVKDKIEKMWGILKSFSTVWDLDNKTISLELKDIRMDTATAGTGDLTNDLTELLVSLGKCAKQADAEICFCIDEIQYAQPEELEAFITAIHRVNQLNLPIVVFCAGLPKILKSVGDAKSYSERLFDFIEIDSLPPDAARDAITVPAEDLNVFYTDDAVGKIIEITDGYPYFIQELCSVIWDNHNTQKITGEVVIANTISLYDKLDAGFFRVRYDRCTPMEKKFISAMVQCGELPCTIAGVAEIMGRKVKSISIFRGQLISKGLIYSTRHGEIDFTVPQFDEFIKRVSPDFR